MEEKKNETTKIKKLPIMTSIPFLVPISRSPKQPRIPGQSNRFLEIHGGTAAYGSTGISLENINVGEFALYILLVVVTGHWSQLVSSLWVGEVPSR